jgi:glycosyltransferase involved in cell wall biosynthesis
MHPVRVKKAAQPTHVVPRWLIEAGFEFRFDFGSSLAHWASVAPGDFGREAVQLARTTQHRRKRAARSTSVTAAKTAATPPGLRPPNEPFRRVALIHDWLTVPGGSEQVLMALLELFPEAEVFTSVYDPTPWPPEIKNRIVHESFVGRLPRAARMYPRLLPLMRRAFRSFDLSGYDLVLSSSHAFAKSSVARGQPHVCYCHTPLRLLWEPRFLSKETVGPIARAGLALASGRLRRLDREDARHLDLIMANSTYTAERIRRYWKREAVVVHPPVAVERFAQLERRPGSAYVVLGRVVPYKRVDLAVAACAQLDRPVIVIGEGRALPHVRKAAGPKATFLGRVPNDEVAAILSEARGVICCADEDFGIVPVEAQAAGVPVIAYGIGGHRDSIVDGRHGVLFHEQTVDAVVAAIERFEGLTFDVDELRANARRFETDRFNREVTAAIGSLANKSGVDYSIPRT